MSNGKGEITMRKEFIERVKREGLVDTNKYRYQYQADNDGQRILRLPIDSLDTTSAINGWEKVWEEK